MNQINSFIFFSIAGQYFVFSGLCFESVMKIILLIYFELHQCHTKNDFDRNDFKMHSLRLRKILGMHQTAGHIKTVQKQSFIY